MNSTRKVFLFVTAASAFLLGPGSLCAQQAGLIGQRHAGIDFTYERYGGSAIDHTFGTAAAVNVPLAPKIDASFGYDLSHTNDADHSLNHNALQASLLTYNRTEMGKAYFAGILGQTWDRMKTFGVLSRDDDAFWGAATGYEIPLGTATAVNAGLRYVAAFRGNKQTLQYRLEGNHWFSDQFGGVASATYNQIGKAPDTLLYTVGVRWTF